MTQPRDNAETRGVEYITPRKSWPRAATPAEMQPAWAGEFVSFDDWVNFATKRLTGTGDQYGPITSVCIDNFGRRCTIGAHFMRARDEGAFPVRFFWDMRPVSPTAEARIRELEGDVRAIELRVDALNTKGFPQKAATQAALDAIKETARKALGGQS